MRTVYAHVLIPTNSDSESAEMCVLRTNPGFFKKCIMINKDGTKVHV